MKKLIAYFAFLGLLFLVPGCSKEATTLVPKHDSKLVFHGFQPLWKLYLESSKGGWKNNDNGRFSNDDAPAMDALLLLYSLTDDKRYLDTLKKIGEKMLSNDDISRGTADMHRGGLILPGWSSTRYTHDNSRTIFLMDDALILLPMVRTYNHLKNTPLAAQYPLTGWLNRAKQEFDLVFRPGWKNVNTAEGYFEDVYYTNLGLNMPMNQYCVPGLLALELYKATGNAEYLQYAIKTGNYVKQNLKTIGNSYVWYYKVPSINYPSIEYDDFSHAQLVIHFVTEMYKQNQVFTKTDLDRFVNTFTTQVMDGNNVFRHFGGMLNETTPLAVGSRYVEDPWLTFFYLLVPYSSEVRAKMDYYRSHRRIIYHSASDYNHIAEFVLLHYAFELKYLN